MLFYRVALRALFLLAALAASSPLVAAQPVDCEELLGEVRALYERQAFDEAAARLDACLPASDLDDPVRLRLYRLAALVALQRGDVAGARGFVLQIFERAPAYEPDPVQDPPSYAALVQIVHDQLAVTPPPALPSPSNEPTDEPSSTEQSLAQVSDPGPIAVDVLLAAGSYGGERGQPGSEGPFSEFEMNSGFASGIRGSYDLSRVVAFGLGYRFFDAPLGARLGTPTPRATSAAVHLVGAFARVRVLPDAKEVPYVQAGLAAVVTALGNERSFGVAPTLEAGVEVGITARLDLLPEIGTAFVLPGDALDQVGGGGDLLTFLSLGLRFRPSR